MRLDDKGFFHFVDRIGDTFRWKGENVATSEVNDAVRDFTGVVDATTYGVSIPGADGRAGMSAIVVNEGFDIAATSRASPRSGCRSMPPGLHPHLARARCDRDVQAEEGANWRARVLIPARWPSRYSCSTRNPAPMSHSIRETYAQIVDGTIRL